MNGPLATTPWLRAPVLLLRLPAVVLAIFGATAVLSVAASSGVLFQSTIASASLHAQARADCPELSRPQVAVAPRADRLTDANTAIVKALRPIDRQGYTVDITQADVAGSGMNLFARPGVLDHVRTLTPRTGRSGVWVPASLGVKPGDRLTGSDHRSLPVAGVYRDLSNGPFSLTPLPRYWCTWKSLILQNIDSPTPPLLLTDAATMSRYATALLSNNPADPYPIAVYGYAPIPVTSIAIDAAARADRRALAVRRDLEKSLPYLASYVGPGLPQIDPLADKITIAHHVQRGLAGSVVPIDLAGTVVALLLVAGTGGFWATHRHREIRLLTSRGVSPGLVGFKAVLETAPAAAAGLLAGVAAARVLVGAIGPASEFPAGTLGRAALGAGIAVAAGLLLIGLIGAGAARERDDRADRTGRLRIGRYLPWELGLLVVAGWLAIDLQSRTGVHVEHTIVTVRSPLVLFPIVGATGALLSLARIGWLALPRVAKLAPQLPRAGYLAVRRLGRSRSIAVALLVGTALPVALLTYASSINTGVRHEITRKYQTNLGAPQVFSLLGVRFTAPDLHGHGTAVVTYPPADGVTPGGASIAVLGIDPATFSRFAFTTATQRRDVNRLRAGAPNAILVNAPTALQLPSIRIGRTRLAVRIVGRSAVFPGLRSGAHPLLVVNRRALARIDLLANRGNQAWTSSAQLAALRRTLHLDGYTILATIDAQVVQTTTGLLPVSWIFGYLRALAVLIGAVAAAGLVFALAARTRQRTVAYVLSRRMSMSQGTHVRSLAIELGVIVGLGWLGGIAAGTGGFALIVSALDVYPDLPPGAQFTLSPAVLVGTAVGGTLAVAIAVAASQHFAERADPADVLRLE